MTCVCDNCGWTGSAEALQPIQDFEERMGTASDCAATYGIALLPEGECPECGCLVHFEAHHRVWHALRAFFDQVPLGYTLEGRVPYRAEAAGLGLFHACGRARDEAAPPAPPPQKGGLFDA